MAKNSVTAREKQRRETVKRYATKTARIKEVIRQAILDDLNGKDDTDVFSATQALNKLPRNASKARLHRRCRLCSRSRSVYRKFGLCRICLRQAAMRGDIPGLVKASW